MIRVKLVSSERHKKQASFYKIFKIPEIRKVSFSLLCHRSQQGKSPFI